MTKEVQNEIDRITKQDKWEIFTYGEDIVDWSLKREMEKILKKLKEKTMQITIELTDAEVEKLLKYMYYAKICGSLAPDVVVTDYVAIKVLQNIALQKKEEKENV